MRKVLFILIIATLLSGCERYSNGKPVNEDTKKVEQQKKEEAKQEIEKSNAKIKEQEDRDQQNIQAASDLKAYFNDSMSESSWYSLIDGYEVTGSIVIIKTSVEDSGVGKAAIKGINNAVWGYSNMKDSKHKFTVLRVLDRDGNTILHEVNPK